MNYYEVEKNVTDKKESAKMQEKRMQEYADKIFAAAKKGGDRK